MICIILVAGHDTKIEQEAKESKDYEHCIGVPKALLPGLYNKKILDYWWNTIKTRQLFSKVYVVSNADKYKHFERWASASDFPVENIVNDGTTTYLNRLGAVADVDLAIRTKRIHDDIMVVSGDMMFQDSKFDIAQVVNYFYMKNDGDLAMCYDMDADEDIGTRGIIEVDVSTRITKFLEKPVMGETTSTVASIVFYCFRNSTLPKITQFLEGTNNLRPNFGHFMSWLINRENHTVYSMKLATGFHFIGKVGIEDYKKCLAYFSEKETAAERKLSITKRAYARVGIMGNPSDGFYGKTIALSISNFWAEVTIIESEKLTLVPHPLNDPTTFGSLEDLHGISRKEGYLGGLRLLQATCKRFYTFCAHNGIALTKRNFALKYDTNIPKQVGLAGSSAIVTATLKCLMQFFNVTNQHLPLARQPDFVLSVEKDELFIQAGLQDRVIQVYEGLVYMDFCRDLIERQGHGNYTQLPIGCLPPLWLAFINDPSDSGKIHSDVTARWRSGDEDVIISMNQIAQLAELAKDAITARDHTTLAQLMNDNFDLRRSLYGDAVLGARCLRMVELARAHGAAVKFPGSGGAVVGVAPDPDTMKQLRKAFQAEGFVFCDVVPNEGGHDHNSPVP